MKWPENRGDGERMEVYRVVITADVATSMGRESVLSDVGDMYDSNTSPTHWDVVDVTCELREATT